MTCIRKFDRISMSEIITPDWVARDMVSIIPEKGLQGKVLDIASKVGEFTIATYNRMVALGIPHNKIAKQIYALPTSGISYEFTRKVFEALELNVKNIITEFTSYDLVLSENKETYIQKLKDMRLKTILGNPPYQVGDGGAGVSSMPLYNGCMDASQTAKPTFISIIMPAKWYTDGKGLKKFRSAMLSDKRIQSIVDYTDSRDCFDGVDIAGGVCHLLWDKNYNGDCSFTNINRGQRKTISRSLGDTESFLRHVEALEIIEKVKAVSSEFYNSRVSSRKPFGLATDVTPLEHGDITLKYNKGKGLYESSLVVKGQEMINKWKLTISYLTAEHAGQSDKNGRKRILSSMDILQPGEICTETYLVVDSVDTEQEVQNLYKYFSTRFVRFMISVLAATQHLSKEKFEYVPVQNLTTNSDIDWSKTIAEIDRQLYDKYGISQSERDFIESMIKPM